MGELSAKLTEGDTMDIRYLDDHIVVCIKPENVLSTDEPGGLPELLRTELGGEIRTVHRLDRMVSGLMVLSRSKAAATELTKQIMDKRFHKAYLAVVHGEMEPCAGSYRDLMFRDKRECKSYVSDKPGKGVQEALLDYRCLASDGDKSLVRIVLHTGRTHQIRCQFAHHGHSLYGEKKYDPHGDGCPLALFSAELGFTHPVTGETMHFEAQPPKAEPWDSFY